MNCARSFMREASEGTQQHAPVIRGCTISPTETSNTYAENCNILTRAVMPSRLAMATWLVQTEPCSITSPLGVPVLPDVNNTYAAFRGDTLTFGPRALHS